MAEYAVGRSDWEPGPYLGEDAEGQKYEDWLTRRYQEDPTYQIPRGYELHEGRVVRDRRNVLIRHPWLIPLLAAGGGAGLMAAGVGGGAAAAGAAGAGGVGAGETAAVTGLAGSGFGAGAGTGAGTGAGAGMLGTIAGTAGRVAPAIGALTGYLGTRGNQDGGQLSPELEALMTELMQGQADRFRETGPLHSATMSGIHQMLPVFAQQGGLGLGDRSGAPNVPPTSDTRPPTPDTRPPVSAPALPPSDPSRRRPLNYPRY